MDIYNTSLYNQLEVQNHLMVNNLHESFNWFYLRPIGFFTFVFGIILCMGFLYWIITLILKCLNVANDYLDVKNQKDTRAWLLLTTPILAYIGLDPLIKYGYNIGVYECAKIASINHTDVFVPFGIFTAYVWYDLFFNRLPTIYVIHHIIIGFVPMIMYFANDTIGMYFTLLVMISELSTVMLNISMLMPAGWFRSFFRLLFAFAFILFRPIMYTSIAINIFICNNYFTFVGYCIAAITITFLSIINIYWTFCILARCCRSRKDKQD